ncbi:MAG: cytochrome family [Solirubrobacteraceae bacterium]|jgi:cytochrome P450|nr:cytochrome family [Solirubrobacteraceae bacterium]
MTLPPGPRLPRAAQTLGWVARPGPWLERLRDRYGDAFTLRIAHEGTWVMLSDPEAVKQVFTGDPAQLHAGEANVILRPLLGPRSVLLLDGREHMAERKLMLPAFHGERMAGYAGLIGEVAAQEVASWPGGTPVAIRPRMQALTLEIVMRAIFGSRDQRLKEALARMLDWTMDPRKMLRVVLAGPDRIERTGFFDPAMRPVDELLRAEIRRRRASEDPGEDVLSLLVEARHDDGAEMSESEIRDELLTLLVAGHETTATALSWALERLARHPAAWERLHTGDEDYLDAVVRETLRLRPVLPIVLRKLQQPMEIGGFELPAGVSVAPCIHLVHRRPDVYPDPHAFRPERFLERPAGTYTWIPFGGGVRRCLGASFALMEMKLVLRAVAGGIERLGPDRPESEPVSRRAITLVPGRDARVVVSAYG